MLVVITESDLGEPLLHDMIRSVVQALEKQLLSTKGDDDVVVREQRNAAPPVLLEHRTKRIFIPAFRLLPSSAVAGLSSFNDPLVTVPSTIAAHEPIASRPMIVASTGQYININNKKNNNDNHKITVCTVRTEYDAVFDLHLRPLHKVNLDLLFAGRRNDSHLQGTSLDYENAMQVLELLCRYNASKK